MFGTLGKGPFKHTLQRGECCVQVLRFLEASRLPSFRQPRISTIEGLSKLTQVPRVFLGSESDVPRDGIRPPIRSGKERRLWFVSAMTPINDTRSGTSLPVKWENSINTFEEQHRRRQIERQSPSDPDRLYPPRGPNAYGRRHRTALKCEKQELPTLDATGGDAKYILVDEA